MGKKPDPTPEELEFIFGFMANTGLSDKAIIQEIQDTETFPPRGVRFITGLRKEFIVAKKILSIKLEKELDPITIENKRNHYNSLASTADHVLKANNIRNIQQGTLKNHQGEIVGNEYVILHDVDGELPSPLTKRQVISLVKQSFEDAEYLGGWNELYDFFVPHLLAEFTNPYQYNFTELVKKYAYEVIDVLRILSEGKQFKGKCPICKDW